MARFTLNAIDRFAISTGERIDPKYWDNQLQQVKTNHPDSQQLNIFLSKFKANLLTLYRDNKDLPFGGFKLLAKGKSEKKSLISLYPEFLNHVKRRYDYNTWKRYNSLKFHLDQIAGTDNIHLLRTNLERRLYTLGDRDSTVSKYIANLKTYLKWAQEEKGLKVDPGYRKWETVKRISEPLTLSLQELHSLETCVLHHTPSIGRDYLVVGARVGMRISDLSRITARNFHTGSAPGECMTLTFHPKKGNRIQNKTITVPLTGFTEPVKRVFEKHNWQLPQISEQKLNKHIKEACRLAGIDEPVTKTYWKGGVKVSETKPKYKWITTHTGRRTFGTLALQFMSPKLVKDLMGISSYQTLKHYEGSSDMDIIKSELQSMGDKLKTA